MFHRVLNTPVSFINPYLANIPILYPLKTFGFLVFSGGYKMGTLARNRFKKSGKSKLEIPGIAKAYQFTFV